MAWASIHNRQLKPLILILTLFLFVSCQTVPTKHQIEIQSDVLYFENTAEGKRKAEEFTRVFEGKHKIAMLDAPAPRTTRARILVAGGKIYPKEMEETGMDAVVIVSMVVDETGSVLDAVATESPHPGFTDSAIAAVKDWIFKPAQIDGKNVRANVRSPVRFYHKDTIAAQKAYRAARVPAGVRYFSGEYRGLRVGVSTISDITETLGAPEFIDKTEDWENRYYEDVTFSFKEKRRPYVDTIQITGDDTYQTPTGVRLGTMFSELETPVYDYHEPGTDVYYDSDFGIIYWTQNDKVTKIVLPRMLIEWKVIDPPSKTPNY